MNPTAHIRSILGGHSKELGTLQASIRTSNSKEHAILSYHLNQDKNKPAAPKQAFHAAFFKDQARELFFHLKDALLDLGETEGSLEADWQEWLMASYENIVDDNYTDDDASKYGVPFNA